MGKRTYQELAEDGDEHAAVLDQAQVETTRPQLRQLLAEADEHTRAALYRIREHDQLAASIGEPSLAEIVAAFGK